MELKRTRILITEEIICRPVTLKRTKEKLNVFRSGASSLSALGNKQQIS